MCIGLFNTFNGSIISYLFSLFLHPQVAFVLGYITSLFIAYGLNSKLNFKQRMSLPGFLRFGVSYIPNFLIQNIVVYLLVDRLDWHRLLVYAIAAAIGVPVTFICVKLIAFRQKDNKKDGGETP